MKRKEKIELFDLIGSYLHNELPAEKRREVEQRMQEDETFRREVALHEELQENFSDPGRLRLRSAMKKMMEEDGPTDQQIFNPQPSFSNNLWKWSIFLAIVVTGLSIWYWLSASKGKLPQQPFEAIPKEQHSEPTNDVKRDTIPIDAPNESVPPMLKPEGKLLLAEANPTDFIPNPTVEALVNSGLRSIGGLTLTMTSPANSATFAPSKKGETSIRFAGVLENTIDEPPFESDLSIFNNRDATNPLVTLQLELRKDPAGLTFEVIQRLQLPQGLFYFTIEREGELLYAGKFNIGSPKR